MTTQTPFRTADLADLQTMTEALEPTLGMSADALGGIRPDLNGLRVKVPGQPQIYLMDQGYRRWIPDPATYNNLFRDWNGVQEDTGVGDIPIGVPIADGAILARPVGGAAVYLVDAGSKRWVTSPTAMDKYYFNWNRVYSVPPILLQDISDGPAIS